MSSHHPPPEGNVQALIDQLRSEGVERGQREADHLIADARRRAARIESDAEERARQTLETARRDAEALSRSTEQALQQALRDAVLRVKNDLLESLAHQLREVIRHRLQDRELLSKIILQIAGEHRPTRTEGAEVILPRDIVGVDDLRRDPHKLREGHLLELLGEHLREVLDSGVVLAAAEEQADGIRLRLSGEDVVVDIDEDTVSAVILRHLRPRFRALLDGVVG